VSPADEAVGAAWDAPFGRGRPGWHLECSAMALEEIGLSRSQLPRARPPPKVPKHIVVVSELPRSDRGKVLRDRLRADWCRRMEAGETGAA